MTGAVMLTMMARGCGGENARLRALAADRDRLAIGIAP
jgi:hypothetical protein